MNSPVATFENNLKFLDLLPTFVFAIVVFVAFYILAKAVSNLINRFNSSKNKQLFTLSTTIIKNIIITVGVLISLSIAGINLQTLITGLGLTGAAMALALKDTLSNFIAGVMILLNKPFKVGDNIRVVDISGVVARIETRFTIVKSGNEKHIVPNSILYNSTVTIITDKK